MVSNVSFWSVWGFEPIVPRLISHEIFLLLNLFHHFFFHSRVVSQWLYRVVNFNFLRSLFAKDSLLLFFHVVVRVTTRKIQNFPWLFPHSFREIRISQSPIWLHIEGVPRPCCETRQLSFFHFNKLRALWIKFPTVLSYPMWITHHRCKPQRRLTMPIVKLIYRCIKLILIPLRSLRWQIKPSFFLMQDRNILDQPFRKFVQIKFLKIFDPLATWQDCLI